MLNTEMLDVTGQRWLASRANYRFKIFYKTGEIYIDVDALSRLPGATVFLHVFQAFDHAIIHEDSPIIESLVLKHNADYFVDGHS